jgi:hypothetical protein
MGSLALAALIASGTFLAGFSLDIGINAAQNWYDVVYQDAFWSSRSRDSPALRELALEEAEIARLLDSPDFETTSQASAATSSARSR